MKSLKNLPRSKMILLCVVIAVLSVFLIYVIMNVVFYCIGMPECFFEYKILENDTIEIEFYSGPFVLMNIPNTINGKPVTSIGDRIFEKTSFRDDKVSGHRYNMIKNALLAVRLPDTVEEIHFAAFEECESLGTINIPANLKFAGWRILAGTKVSKLVFPEGITEIGCGDDVDLGDRQCFDAFAGMKYLYEIEFPESLKKIGNNAFADCTNLKKTNLPDGIEEIKYGAFQNSGLEEVNIPKSLTKNSGCIFKGTPFEKSLETAAKSDFIIFNDVLLYKYIGDDENVVIPDGIECICDRAFWNAPNIRTVDIPESVKYINYAFELSSVENLVIPDTVDPDSCMSFYGCRGLKNIVLSDRMTEIQNHAFEKCVSLESIIIPESVAYIGDYAFCECSSLKKVTIEGAPQMGDNVFESCNAIVYKAHDKKDAGFAA